MIDQLDLFAGPLASSTARIKRDTERMLSQHDHLASVGSRIGAAITAFCRARVGREFHADTLRRHVTAQVGVVAPGSADRILRDLRQRGVVVYSVVNRRQSLYRVDRVP
jgi:hypothetical protein